VGLRVGYPSPGDPPFIAYRIVDPCVHRVRSDRARRESENVTKMGTTMEDQQSANKNKGPVGSEREAVCDGWATHGALAEGVTLLAANRTGRGRRSPLQRSACLSGPIGTDNDMWLAIPRPAAREKTC